MLTKGKDMAKDKNKKNEVLIDLSDSTYAHSFEEQNRIHQVEFAAAVTLVENQIKGLVKTIGFRGRKRDCQYRPLY